MAANAGGDSGGFDLMLVENAVDNVGHVIELHYLTINDGVCLEIFEPQIYQLKAVALLLQLDGFDRTGTDIKADKISLTFLKHSIYSSRQRESVSDAVAASGREPSLLLKRGSSLFSFELLAYRFSRSVSLKAGLVAGL
jgi:hypothetical protein